MPIKYNLTKYDMLFSKIKRAAANKGPLSKDEQKAMRKAVIVAAFTSGHSWQTYKTLTSPTPASFNSAAVKKEYEDSVATNWKNVTPFDIHEVANTNVSDTSFSHWLFFNVGKDHQEEYKGAWMELKSELEEDCDNVERASYRQ
jgi:hypothetical protein